jgi:hypothetical protein
MPQLAVPFEERTRELGQFLLTARSSQNSSITTCAERIGTSPRRDVAMEQGEAMTDDRVPRIRGAHRLFPYPASRDRGPLFSLLQAPSDAPAGDRGEPGQQRAGRLQVSPRRPSSTW